MLRVPLLASCCSEAVAWTGAASSDSAQHADRSARICAAIHLIQYWSHAEGVSAADRASLAVAAEALLVQRVASLSTCLELRASDGRLVERSSRMPDGGLSA